MLKDKYLISIENIEKRILLIRGEKVLLDSDLSELYGVETKILNRSVRRHIDRFPDDFMFQLTKEEFDNLRRQFDTSNLWGGRRYLPYVFTEQGVAMLSSVLNSSRAIQVNIAIMRVFVKLREIISNHKTLYKKLQELEERLTKHDKQILTIVQVIKNLTNPNPPPPKRRIGYIP